MAMSMEIRVYYVADIVAMVVRYYKSDHVLDATTSVRPIHVTEIVNWIFHET
jgi:hypothetical protein